MRLNLHEWLGLECEVAMGQGHAGQHAGQLVLDAPFITADMHLLPSYTIGCYTEGNRVFPSVSWAARVEDTTVRGALGVEGSL